MFFLFFNTFLVLFLIYLFYKYILNPWLVLQLYKKQGIPCYFYPFTGLHRVEKKNLALLNDSFLIHSSFSETGLFATNSWDKIILFVNKNEIKKDFFLNKSHFYSKNLDHFSLIAPIVTANNIFLTEGEKWKESRRTLSKLMNFDFVKSLFPEFNESIDKILSQSQKSNNLSISSIRHFEFMAIKIAIEVFLGPEFQEKKFQNMKLSNFIISLLDEAKRNQKRFNYFGLFTSLERKTFDRICEEFRNFIATAIKEKFKEFNQNKKNENSRFLNTIFIEFKDQKDGVWVDNLIYDLVLLLVASTDTIGRILAHSIYYLSKNSNCMEKLEQEIFSKNEEFNYNKLNEYDYLNGVINETLRFASPIPALFPRIALKDHYLDNLKIKKGTIVDLRCVDHKLFVKQECFEPERWINKNNEMFYNQKNPYDFIPFSHGERNCIGQHLALMETKILMIKLLKEFKFERKEKDNIKWVRRFLYEPEKVLILIMKKRE